MKDANRQYYTVRFWWRGLLFGQFFACLIATHSACGQQTDVITAERLTHQAVDAGLTGDLKRRHELLSQAIQVEPDYALARWEMGQIFVDGRWSLLEDAQTKAAQDLRLERYREFLRSVPNDPAAHLQLARWARRNQLTDESRFHWLRVLSADTLNDEALLALDSTWHDGCLVSKDMAEKLRRQDRIRNRVDRRWQVLIAKWERAMSEGTTAEVSALEELRRVVDVTAIPQFERLASAQELVTSSVAERRQRLSLAFLEALSAIPSYKATESLVRHAILAADEPVRSAATNLVVDRPLHECMPLLMSGLASPIETNVNLSVSPNGYVSYSHEFFAVGPKADQVFERAQSASFHVSFMDSQVGLNDVRRAAQIAQAVRRSRALAQRKASRFQREAHRVEQQVAAENARRSQINQRITNVLGQVVGEDLGDDPLAWWEYWQDYNEYERRPYRPSDYERVSSCEYETIVVPPMTLALAPPRPPSGPSSCFVAGTPVWTKTGLTAIESLVPGDLVLSRDTATGELLFRPVLATTQRLPSPTLGIVANGREIRTTLGHPFWLPTIGWRMAKELAPGDRLLAVGDPAVIDEISPAGVHVAFNLVVDGPGNYFVGQDGLLVHDNTPRRPELVRLGVH